LPTWRNRLVVIAAETTISSTAPTSRAGRRSRGGGPTRTVGARRGARPPAGGDGAGGPDGGVRVAMALLSDGGQLTVWASATRRVVVEVRSSGGSVPLALTTPVAVQVTRQVVVAVTG
jgi:hypothetical protein